ncbi:MAG: DNA methyltransferase [Pseudomonas fluorescens]
MAKWGPGGPAYDLNERQGAQPHFIDLCQLLGVPTPGSAGDYLFEQDTLVLGEARGYADVFKRNHFAWENKAPGKNLDTALKQLLTYSLALSNPPLLVVCDRLTIRIHTQFNGHPSEVHTVLLAELDRPDKQALLRRLWNDPESFRPKKTSRDITEAAAKSFATLADGLRKRDQDADEVAHFLTQCLFCFFAEDVGLLPGKMFERLVNNKALTSDKLSTGLTNLFGVMRDGGLYGNDDIPRFNGGLFKKVKVPALSIMEVTELRNAAGLNWSAIDVSIFGTLFERGLDPAKRSQLGAHYTDPATILRIIDPVLTRPLMQQWTLIAQEIMELMSKSKQKKRAAYSSAGRHFKASAGDTYFQMAERLFHQWLTELSSYRVLDPACGSGNFLFMGLKALKDIEHKSHLDAAALGLDREADLVTGPHNVLGIELNEYAAELARVTVWIGELQWRLAHGYEFKTNPVLEPLDHIECRDALLTFSMTRNAAETGSDHNFADHNFAQKNSCSDLVSADHTMKAAQATEASWPKANVVIGNPPFLGDRKMIRELGEAYTSTLRKTYEGRVPGGADLVCYWFEKARIAIELNGLQAAGLVATNSIRGGANRKVLDAICASTRIFDAWSDEGWVNEGAAVRVSLVCFGEPSPEIRLNGLDQDSINADLTVGGKVNTSPIDLTLSKKLSANLGTAFVGVQRNGPFDVDGSIARTWLLQPNPHGKGNAQVLRPSVTAIDVTRRPQDRWLVDFGLEKDVSNLAAFEIPFGYVEQRVKPTRVGLRRAWHATYWWLYGDPRPAMRKAIGNLQRYLVTPQISKHRVFAFVPSSVLTENANIAIARQDDVTFGVLQSRFHELWSLRMCTWLGVGNDPRYTNSTTFETFPFPAGLTPADTAHQRTDVLEGGAVIPAGLPDAEGGWGAGGSAQVKEPAGEGRRAGDTEQSPLRPNHPHHAHQAPDTRAKAIAIAQAAKKLNDLREAWLNPPEWTHKVPEVIPLGLDKSPYPDRIEPKPGISEHDQKALQKRTLTNLYNAKPAWLSMAHQQLDQAVASAYGWADYRADMPDDEILKRLLALNLARSSVG